MDGHADAATADVLVKVRYTERNLEYTAPGRELALAVGWCWLQR